MFSEKTLQCLQNAVWTPERQVDISDWEGKLNQLGITLSPVAHEFMGRYAGLDIRVPYHSEILGDWKDDIQFELIDPVFEFFGRRVCYAEEYQGQTGITMFLIGHRHAAHVKLLMSPDGSIFEDTEDYLIRYTHLTDNASNIIDEFLSTHLPIEVFDEVKNCWVPWDQISYS